MTELKCPYCRRHCDLDMPQCMQGRTYAEAVEKAGGKPVAADPVDINRKMLRCLRQLGRTISAVSEGRAGQSRVLRVILESGGIAQNALTQRLGVMPGTASEVIGKLESAGYIDRKPNAFDRRTFDLDLTEEGKKKARLLQEDAEKRRANMFTALSGEEKQQLLTLLEKLSADWKQRYGSI